MCYVHILSVFFVFKQKTAYEMRISDWSSDVCSSDLGARLLPPAAATRRVPCWRRACRRAPRAPSASARRRAGPAGPSSAPPRLPDRDQIGRASCRDRVCQYVSISVVAVSLKKKNQKHNSSTLQVENPNTKTHI